MADFKKRKKSHLIDVNRMRHDTQDNDIQYNDIQHKDTQLERLIWGDGETTLLFSAIFR